MSQKVSYVTEGVIWCHRKGAFLLLTAWCIRSCLNPSFSQIVTWNEVLKSSIICLVSLAFFLKGALARKRHQNVKKIKMLAVKGLKESRTNAVKEQEQVQGQSREGKGDASETNICPFRTISWSRSWISSAMRAFSLRTASTPPDCPRYLSSGNRIDAASINPQALKIHNYHFRQLRTYFIINIENSPALNVCIYLFISFGIQVSVRPDITAMVDWVKNTKLLTCLSINTENPRVLNICIYRFQHTCFRITIENRKSSHPSTVTVAHRNKLKVEMTNNGDCLHPLLSSVPTTSLLQI